MNLPPRISGGNVTIPAVDRLNGTRCPKVGDSLKGREQILSPLQALRGNAQRGKLLTWRLDRDMLDRSRGE